MKAEGADRLLITYQGRKSYMWIHRGDIIEADFGIHANSSIQAGIRPAIVVSNNKANRHSTILTVVPLSARISKKTYLPTHVFVHICEAEGLKQNSIALAEQVTALEWRKILKTIGKASSRIMEELTKAVQIQTGVYEGYN